MREGFDPWTCAMETFIGALNVLNLVLKLWRFGGVK